jgi:D-alanyl-D-alanine carboxypeptidase/D-alanyl-D-alanine-endopeptidase (penicillin-binding protein 4)
MTAVLRRGLVAVTIVLTLAPCAGAAKLPLPTRLASALAVPGSSPKTTGAIAVDLLTGKTVFSRNADVPLAPASNEKLLVTYGALVELGAQYRFKTQLLATGSQDGAVWHGNLVLKGSGDPSLSSLYLLRLATQLKALGITRVDGHVLGDDSWFDNLRTAPGWKPSFFLRDSAPISALEVDDGTYAHHVTANPPLAAAARLRQMLRKRGITTGPVGVGRAPVDAVEVAHVLSAPLATILRYMDLESDNLHAEMILKQLGAVAGTGGTSAAGAEVVLHDLADAHVPLTGVRMFDGSGLSEDDRVTARALSALLTAAWRSPELRATFLHALPVAGVSGTLKDRLDRRPAYGAVHAKTGSTDLASALSGYVRNLFAFSVLQNGYPVSWWATRKAQDRFATALSAP